ncbi:type 11 methyltransferase [Natrialba chahannaoensis JCM 10990]|uniref:Type 11 methyltransferase n=1 Tax=Natrialba chahannaoensis JCM 10990 TaxID=1227492 RepID=M0AQV7_9EURY|nr:type 11 methyltransferase [Natrialba chahannaoensis JCM 10990]
MIAVVEYRLRDEYFVGGTWIADYRRLRVVAVQPSAAQSVSRAE